MAIKPSPRQQKSETTRTLILESALELFNQYGYETVTINEIVQNIGLTKGAFYCHFRSKGDLLVYSNEIVGKKIEEKYNALISLPDYADKTALEKIESLIKVIMRTSIDSNNLSTLSQLIVSVMNNPPDDAKTHFELHQTDAMVKEIILEGQLSGELRTDISCEELLRDIHIFQRALLLEWCYKQGKYDIIERNADIIRVFCRGMKPADISSNDTVE